MKERELAKKDRYYPVFLLELHITKVVQDT